MRSEASQFFLDLQTKICAALERCDSKATFKRDVWERKDLTGEPGGGGVSAVLTQGGVFEKAGVNFSAVEGRLPADMSEKLTGKNVESAFNACGVSLVLHPSSPLVPTTHANFRYIEVEDLKWFGGGSDLTPYYLYDEDARHFHSTLKISCDRHSATYYPEFKKWCDEYFFLPHRGETRGVGGLFFDYLGKGNPASLPQYFAFVKDAGSAFLDAYLPIVEKRRSLEWTKAQKDFQLVRRGRYVEFNLLYDRGTLFGLKTAGRTESILMSLPPEVRWEYNYMVTPGSPEERLLAVLQHPQEWAV